MDHGRLINCRPKPKPGLLRIKVIGLHLDTWINQKRTRRANDRDATPIGRTVVQTTGQRYGKDDKQENPSDSHDYPP